MGKNKIRTPANLFKSQLKFPSTFSIILTWNLNMEKLFLYWWKIKAFFWGTDFDNDDVEIRGTLLKEKRRTRKVVTTASYPIIINSKIAPLFALHNPKPKRKCEIAIMTFPSISKSVYHSYPIVKIITVTTPKFNTIWFALTKHFLIQMGYKRIKK